MPDNNPFLLKTIILPQSTFLRPDYLICQEGLPKILFLTIYYFSNSFFFFAMKQVVCQLCKRNLSSAAAHDKVLTWPKLKEPGVLLSTRCGCFLANIPAPYWRKLQRRPHFCLFLDSAFHRGKCDYGVGWNHHVLT